METIALTFGSPLWLWGLLALPVFAALYVWSHLRGRALISKVVAPRLRDQLAGSVSVVRRVARGILIVLTLGLVLVALAQPRYGFIQREIKQKGRDIIVAVDTSKSMLATDVAPTRLARAKLLTQDLIRLLKGDRIGLIAFAGSAFLQAPLTLDYGAAINALDELDTNVIPKGGTDIASAIATAEQAFGKAEGQTRALILLTDGEELDEDGVAAAKKAAEHGIRIFTVGIGSPEGSLIPFRSEDGRQDFVRDVSGKPVQTKLDETRLKEIAKATGGFFVPIGPDAAKEIFQQGIEPMDATESGVLSARQPLERYQWPLGLAVGFLMLWLLLGEKRRGRPRAAVAAAALALALALAPRLDAASSGLQDYQSGNFDRARKVFEQQLKKSPDSREVQFNAGASAYKLGDFEQAISHFTSALLSEDNRLREDAAYNLANSLVRRGEAASDKSAKKSDWKNAIEQYTEALNLDSKNKQAQENRDIVKKLLEELDKQEKQQDKKQDQKKDQKDQQNKQDQQNKDQKDQQNKQDQQNKDQKDQQNKQDQQNKDQKDQQNKQDQQNKDQKDQQNKQDQQNKGQKDQKDQEDKQDQSHESPKSQNSQDDQKKSAPKPTPAPTPTPGEKKEGDVKANAGDEKKDQKPEEQAAAASEEQGKDGQMSAAQARALLKSLNSEEEKVNLIQQPTSQEVLRDW